MTPTRRLRVTFRVSVWLFGKQKAVEILRERFMFVLRMRGGDVRGARECFRMLAGEDL